MLVRNLRAVHPAWIIAVLTLLALVAGAAFRSTTGALFEPLESEFGGTRTGTSGAVTLNLVVYGLTAPFAAAAMERLGVKRVVIAGLALTALGSGLTVVMTELWQLWLLWGLFVGTGTGVMALVFGSIVANRWFATRRGLVMGFFSGANACGQLVFLPLIVALTHHPGWRAAALASALVAAAIIPFMALFFADSPQAIGRRPFGEDPAQPVPAPGPAKISAGRLALTVLRDSLSSRAFWILVFTFWVCGWSTNGLIQTHFIPAAHDHGMPAATAAGLLALIGVFDIAGTVASGWLTDRFNPALLLVAYYGLRGLSLVFVNSLLGPGIEPPLWLFIVFYGLDWVATVPPTVALCRIHFGLERAGIVFGWVFASHMVGAGVAAAAAGWIRESTGSYLLAWVSAAVLCGLAALSLLALRRAPEPEREPVPEAAA
ncbi:MFS transporter [Arthrobacter mobilis]|uniref:MFS transporter n=1 Tax=Arthrobacter mobilis TaxID=2724944 RepID=A0A7X6HE21_9MICC|nr:MFS transporter [Arthrobacter mobilis]NKX54276.1 MFS transporter [Arthrobacter mobilis]